MKLAFFSVENWEKPIIENVCKTHNLELVRLAEEPLNDSVLPHIASVEIISIHGYDPMPAGRIDQLPDIKLITTRTTGFDHIDTLHARHKGIPVINVPAYGSDTVAEYTFALILSLTRKLKLTLLKTSFAWFDRKDSRGIDLAGKTLGVVGTGRIASRVIKMARGFDMNIIGYDVHPNKELIEKYNVEYRPLQELFCCSDVISIHVPYMPETHHLVNADLLNLVKPGTLLVNTARGAIVDTHALLEAMRKGRLGGVALDTFEGEEIWTQHEHVIKNSNPPDAEIFRKGMASLYLLHFSNAILTPHNAFNTKEAVRRILDTNLEDIVSFAKTGKCTGNCL